MIRLKRERYKIDLSHCKAQIYRQLQTRHLPGKAVTRSWIVKRCFKNYLLVSVLAFNSGLITPLAAQTFTTLYTFTPTYSYVFNRDGASPSGVLILSENLLYGTAQVGGTSGFGTVFRLGTNGGGFATLHDFASLADEGVPEGLTLSSNVLYGTGYAGGSFQDGSVFRLNADGTDFTDLYMFSGQAFPV